MPTEIGWIVHLDPSGAATTPRVELDLNSGPLNIDQKGIDWGDAAITGYMADQQMWGSNLVSFRVPNRIVRIPLFIGAEGDDFQDGIGNGTTTFSSATANFSVLDLNEPILETDGGGFIPAGTTIISITSPTQVVLSHSVGSGSPIKFLLPNRAETGRAKLQQKVALMQREGGWLMRQRQSGDPMYADVVNATLTMPDVWLETGGVQPDVMLTLECLPDFYGDWIDLDAITVSAEPGHYDQILLQTIGGVQGVAQIKGDHPGRCKITISDASSNQLGLLWGFRSQHLQTQPITSNPWTASTSYPNGSLVVPASANGLYYKATQVGTGVSGSTQPTWPTHTGSVTDGTVTWTLQGTNLEVTPSNALVINAQDMVLLSGSGVVTDSTGASGEVVQTNFVQTFNTPMLSLELAADGGTPLTHEGVYEVWVRAKTTSTLPPNLQLVWGQGSIASPTRNDPIGIPRDGQWYLLDLGQIRLIHPSFGNLQWFGQLQVQQPDRGYIDRPIQIDQFIFLPLDESAGQLAYNPLPTPSAQIWAFDDFRENTTTSEVALTGKQAPYVWDTGTNAPAISGAAVAKWQGHGSSNDFHLFGEIDSQPVPYTYRTADSDDVSNLYNGGRVCTIGSAIEGAIVTAQLSPALFTNPPQTDRSIAPGQDPYLFCIGIVLRYVDVNNFIGVGFNNSGVDASGREIWQLIIWKVGGSGTRLLFGTTASSGTQENASITNIINGLSSPPDGVGSALPSNPTQVSARVSTGGVLQVLLNDTLVVTLSDPDLVQGSSLGSGTCGIYAYNGSSDISPMYVQDFLVQELNSDAVVYSGSSVVLSTEGMLQLATGMSPISNVIGDLPRIPPSGLEGRPCELLIRPTQGDLQITQDTALSGFTTQVSFRPTWLFRP